MLIKFLIVGLSISIFCNVVVGWLCHTYYSENEFLNDCMNELIRRCMHIMIEHDIDINELRKGNETSDIEIEHDIKLK